MILRELVSFALIAKQNENSPLSPCSDKHCPLFHHPKTCHNIFTTDQSGFAASMKADIGLPISLCITSAQSAEN